jgi:hypothetical protein
MKVVSYKGDMSTMAQVEPGMSIELYPSKELARVVHVDASRMFPRGKLVSMDVWQGQKLNTWQWNVRDFPPEAPVKVLNGKMVELLLERVGKQMADQNRVTTIINHLGMGVSLGTDPEVFVRKGDGSLLPAFEFLGPKQGSSGYESPFWDGFQAEFTTYSGGCIDGQTTSCRAGLMEVLRRARNVDPKAKLVLEPVIEVPTETLKKYDKKFTQFGCSPSMNVHGLSTVLPDDHTEVTIRPAGFHLHFGNPMLQIPYHARNVVRALDVLVGLPFVALMEGIDDPRRRALYGLPGEFRMPAHGLEYRTLSSAGLCHPAIYQLAFELGRIACRVGTRGVLPVLFKYDPKEVAEIITRTDAGTARKFMAQHKEAYEKCVTYRFLGMYHGSLESNKFSFWRGIEGGVGALVKDPHNLESNWDLDRSRHDAMRCSRWSQLAERVANSKQPVS